MPDSSPNRVAEEIRNGPNTEPLAQLCQKFREVFAQSIGDFADPRDAISVAMSAGIVFAGIQAGQLIAMGDLDETSEQFAQFSRMIEANFGFGMDIGKKHTAAHMADVGAVN